METPIRLYLVFKKAKKSYPRAFKEFLEKTPDKCGLQEYFSEIGYPYETSPADFVRDTLKVFEQRDDVLCAQAARRYPHRARIADQKDTARVFYRKTMNSYIKPLQPHVFDAMSRQLFDKDPVHWLKKYYGIDLLLTDIKIKKSL